MLTALGAVLVILGLAAMLMAVADGDRTRYFEDEAAKKWANDLDEPVISPPRS